MKERKGFTLIELLVVISVIAVLMAILMPSLGRARDQARGVACRSNLRQWGIGAIGFAYDNRDRLVAEYDEGIWHGAFRPYMGGKTKAVGVDVHAASTSKFSKTKDVGLCPSANKPRWELDGSQGPGFGLGPRSAWGRWGSNVGDAWDSTNRDLGTSNFGLSGFAGSYAFNSWMYKVTFRDADQGHQLRKQWGTFLAKGANRIPLIGGNYSYVTYSEAWDAPPENEVGAEYVGLASYAVNRHNGSINMVFLDGSVRKVGLKELWSQNLKWHREWTGDLATATSRAGIRWPDWMKGLSDY